MGRWATVLPWAAALAGCETAEPVDPIPILPPTRPAGLVPPQPERSESGLTLNRHYVRLETDPLAQGSMRKDGGGPNTPFNADDLARNFEAIVFYDEYRPSAGLSKQSPGELGRLRRWNRPVRIGIGFGHRSRLRPAHGMPRT